MLYKYGRIFLKNSLVHNEEKPICYFKTNYFYKSVSSVNTHILKEKTRKEIKCVNRRE